MNKPKFSDKDYIDFLIASPHGIPCTEAARVQPEHDKAPALDAITRLLYRLQTDQNELWQEARSQVKLTRGILVIDDSTLDERYARHMALVHRQWSAKHRRVVLRHRLGQPAVHSGLPTENVELSKLGKGELELLIPVESTTRPGIKGKIRLIGSE